MTKMKHNKYNNSLMRYLYRQIPQPIELENSRIKLLFKARKSWLKSYSQNSFCSSNSAKFIESSIHLGEYLVADLRRRAGSTHEIYDIA